MSNVPFFLTDNLPEVGKSDSALACACPAPGLVLEPVVPAIGAEIEPSICNDFPDHPGDDVVRVDGCPVWPCNASGLIGPGWTGALPVLTEVVGDLLPPGDVVTG